MFIFIHYILFYHTLFCLSNKIIWDVDKVPIPYIVSRFLSPLSFAESLAKNLQHWVCANNIICTYFVVGERLGAPVQAISFVQTKNGRRQPTPLPLVVLFAQVILLSRTVEDACPYRSWYCFSKSILQVFFANNCDGTRAEPVCHLLFCKFD